jgi:hypothetical protein
MGERASRQLKLLVARRANRRCEYCLSPEAYCPNPFSVDHIIPSSLGGGFDSGNLAYTCSGCNGHKFTATHAIDPQTNGLAPLYHPRQQRWSDHFRWQEDFSIIGGTSPTGRATVERLRLNRVEVVNLRCILRMAGILPLEPSS